MVRANDTSNDVIHDVQGLSIMVEPNLFEYSSFR